MAHEHGDDDEHGDDQQHWTDRGRGLGDLCKQATSRRRKHVECAAVKARRAMIANQPEHAAEYEPSGQQRGPQCPKTRGENADETCTDINATSQPNPNGDPR